MYDVCLNAGNEAAGMKKNECGRTDVPKFHAPLCVTWRFLIFRSQTTKNVCHRAENPACNSLKPLCSFFAWLCDDDDDSDDVFITTMGLVKPLQK